MEIIKKIVNSATLYIKSLGSSGQNKSVEQELSGRTFPQAPIAPTYRDADLPPGLFPTEPIIPQQPQEVIEVNQVFKQQQSQSQTPVEKEMKRLGLEAGLTDKIKKQ